MKSQRKVTRRIFNLALTASILLGGFAPSGNSGGQFLVSGLAASSLPAAQEGGEGWRLVNNGLTNLTIAALAIDPVNPARIYAGTIGAGFFKSTDGGATWSNVGLNARFGRALAINFANPEVVYAGTSDGGFCNANRPLFTSTDGGASWSNRSSMADCDISLIVIDPTSPRTLYAGSLVQYLEVGSTFLWKSTDGGATWSRTDNAADNIGLGPYGSYGLAINPANPQILYAPGDLYANGRVTDSGLFMSEDGGANWRPTGLTNAYIRAVAIDPITPGTLYAGSENNSWAERPIPFRGMFKSTNGGASWLAINNGLANIKYITSIVIDRDNTNVLYIGSDGGVFKSVDGGSSWSAFSDGLTNLEVFDLALAPGNPNTLYAGTRIGVFKVMDNTPGPNPIDDPQFFVRQHYLDFLNREPDPLAAQWVNLINACPPGDTRCDRIHVSEAFFKSPEFQERGYFLYRFYPVSFGRKPDYAEFMADLQRVSAFLTAAELEAAKTSLINDFIARNAFRTKYESLSNQTYVDELLATAGVSLSNRQALIDALNSGSQTRAQVLRQVVESNEVYQNFYNQAFVVMQYFGYLRRDPDILYLNWIATLDANPSDSRHMITGFVNSIEYRQRFGP